MYMYYILMCKQPFVLTKDCQKSKKEGQTPSPVVTYIFWVIFVNFVTNSFMLALNQSGEKARNNHWRSWRSDSKRMTRCRKEQLKTSVNVTTLRHRRKNICNTAEIQTGMLTNIMYNSLCMYTASENVFFIQVYSVGGQ